jgi:hypothetical protein
VKHHIDASATFETYVALSTRRCPTRTAFAERALGCFFRSTEAPAYRRDQHVPTEPPREVEPA